MSDRRSGHCWEAALDGDVTPRVVAHVTTCAECSRCIRGIDDAVERLRGDLPTPPVRLDALVLGALACERATTSRRAGRPRAARAALIGLAAGLASLLAIGIDPLVTRDDSARAAVPIVRLTADCRSDDGPGARGLVVAGTWSGREAAQFTKVLERFERRAGVQVTYAYETRNIAAKLESRIKRGCAPDIALLPQPGLLADLARRGELEPLDAATRRLVRRNYGTAWQRLGTFDDRPFGVWFKGTNKSTVWYDSGAFRAAGIRRPPETWTELLDVAARLRASGRRPFAVAGASPWSLTDWFENMYLRSAGPHRYDALAAHRIPWTDPSVARAFHDLSLLFGDETFVGEPTEVLETTFEESVDAVFSAPARAAMVYEGDFVLSFIPHDGRAQFFAFPGPSPAGKRGVVVGGDIAARFKDSGPAAGALMRFLATPGAAATWARAGGFLSPNRGLDLGVYGHPLMRRAARSLVGAEVVEFDLSDLQPSAFGATAEQGMWKIFQQFVERPEDPDTVMRRLEAGATAARRCARALGGRC